jgi:hypothetical protein
MLDYKQRLDNAMLQLQYIIDEEYEDNDNVQDAFNMLAVVLDEETARSINS